MQEPQETRVQPLGREDPSTLRDEEMPTDGDLTARTCWSNNSMLLHVITTMKTMAGYVN